MNNRVAREKDVPNRGRFLITETIRFSHQAADDNCAAIPTPQPGELFDKGNRTGMEADAASYRRRPPSRRMNRNRLIKSK